MKNLSTKTLSMQQLTHKCVSLSRSGVFRRSISVFFADLELGIHFGTMNKRSFQMIDMGLFNPLYDPEESGSYKR